MKTYTLLLSLLCFSIFLTGQEVLLFDDTQEQTLVYRYSQLSGPEAAILRPILQTLQPNQLQQAALDVHYRYQLRILEGANKLKNCLQWEAAYAERAPAPLGFRFEDLLAPSGATYNLELLADGEVVATQCVQQVFGQDLPTYSFDFPTPAGGIYYTLRVSDLSFKYENRQVQAVQQRRRAIDQYLIAKDKLTALQLSLTAFDQLAPRPQQLDSYRRQLQSYEEQLKRIISGSFWNTLQLGVAGTHDPEGLKTLRVNCEKVIFAQHQRLDELVATLHILYFEQGLLAYQNSNLNVARDAFRASLNADDCYAPSHYFLAVLDFDEGDTEAAAQRIRLVLNRYAPDPQIRAEAQQLASEIVRFYLDAGQNAVALRQYSTGVATYQQALAFSKSINGFQFGQTEAHSRIQEAYFFDFHDQLDRVTRAKNSGQYQLALELLNPALNFQERFQVNSTVDTYGLAREIVNGLHQEQLAQIRDYRYQEDWDRALSVVASAEKLLQSYPGMVNKPQQLALEKERILLGKHQKMIKQTETLIQEQQLDQALTQAEASRQFVQDNQLGLTQERESQRLITRVQQLRYDRFLAGGDRAREKGNYLSALKQYELAQALERSAELLMPNQELRQKISATALLEGTRIYQLVFQQAADDNEQLRATKQQLQVLAERFNIRQEEKLRQMLLAIDDQQCTNARDLLLPQEEEQLANEQRAGDYIAAQATLTRIAALLSTYPNCALNEATLLMNQRAVTACSVYQEQLEAAKKAQKQQQYSKAIVHLVAANDSYRNPLVQVRLAPPPAGNLYEYVTAHEDYRMPLAAGHYYLDQREHELSLQLLQLLIDRGIMPRATESLQLRLGSALAVRHYAESAHWKSTFYGIIPKEERKLYKELYRAFRKQWKRMA